MNRQELYEETRAAMYELYAEISSDETDAKDGTFFDVISALMYHVFEDMVGEDLLNKSLFEMTPDEFADNMLRVFFSKDDIVEFILNRQK